MIRKGKLGKVLAMVMGLCNAVPLVDAVSKKGVSNSSYTVGNIVTHSKKNNKPVSKLKQEKQSKNAISKPKLLVSERLKGGMGRFQKGTLGSFKGFFQNSDGSINKGKVIGVSGGTIAILTAAGILVYVRAKRIEAEKKKKEAEKKKKEAEAEAEKKKKEAEKKKKEAEAEAEKKKKEAEKKKKEAEAEAEKKKKEAEAEAEKKKKEAEKKKKEAEAEAEKKKKEAEAEAEAEKKKKEAEKKKKEAEAEAEKKKKEAEMGKQQGMQPGSDSQGDIGCRAW